ncbi:thermonuclease family protein [Chryseomicrobium palamuruense]|uniref:Thermonuclease family protein n=1 Tax=Chryseomicrobium palamuruense TaxID=682973 RepID=A0ABV8UT35_9BACL
MKTWIGLLVIVALLSGCQLFETSTSSEEVEIVEVVDGDTIRIKWQGDNKLVRYLLIDTPETNHPRLGKQPFGEEAKALNEELLKNASVSIEFDIGERYDDYGRLLAYVYADGERVQDQLVAAGVARVAYVYPPNTRYLDELEEAQKLAKGQQLGVWAYDYYVTDRGFDAASYDLQESDNPECTIKGNINRQGEKIYHVPEGRYYSQTNPEEWFCSERQARDAGFRKSGQ